MVAYPGSIRNIERISPEQKYFQKFSNKTGKTFLYKFPLKGFSRSSQKKIHTDNRSVLVDGTQISQLLAGDRIYEIARVKRPYWRASISHSTGYL
jgi:hypothetical protein